MDDAAAGLFLDAAIATGLGLMIGLEREHHEVEKKGDPVMLGVRTFALLGLLGWASGYLGLTIAWLPPLALLVTGILVAAGFLRGVPQAGRGLTTEVAALVTFLLGMLVSRSRTLSVGVAVLTTLLLVSKPWFERFVPRLRRMDITATLQMAILMAVVLPLLPTEARDPWHVLAPRRIGLFVTLIIGVDYVGYVLNRTLGQRRGAGLTGLLGGLTSSTAVTATMAQNARRDPGSHAAGQLATCLANAVMAARIVVIAAVASRRVALAVAPSLAAMFVVFVAAAVWRWREAKRNDAPPGAPVELKNPLALVPAIEWGAFLCAVLIVSAVGQQLLGDRGVLAAAALSGLADVDAITLTVAKQSDGGTLAIGTAVLAIVIAASMNNVIKAGIALVSGGARYGRVLALVFGVALAAAIGTALLTGLG